jgi:peroxiredoxin
MLRRFRLLAASYVAIIVVTFGLAISADSPPAERMLPRFSGRLLDGGVTSSDALQGRRALLFSFATTQANAEPMAQVIAGLAAEAEQANVAILGLYTGARVEQGLAFARQHGLRFPIVADTDRSIQQKLRLPPGFAAVLVVDSRGAVQFGTTGVEGTPEQIRTYLDGALRRELYLAPPEGQVLPALGVLPPAPAFQVQGLDATVLTLDELRGKVVAFVFFLPTCPHCHEMLKFLKRISAELANPDFTVVAVSVSNQRYVIEDMAEELALPFPLYVDASGQAQKDYGFRFSVPDLFLIDREGRVVVRQSGASPRIEALLTMHIRQALGVPNPILLDRLGYSGEELCSVCHPTQHATWSITPHSHAFETLLKHGADKNPECVACHTVGFGANGGYSIAKPEPHLEGVQCENCHGRGGPHQSPDFAKNGYESVCAGCHTPQHSLRFQFAERLPQVSHLANASKLASLTIDERRALLDGAKRRERELFEKADYVGTEVCQSCHAKEHAAWEKSPHATAFATLEKQGKAGDADCQRCHTTGFGEPTGWPAGGNALLGVGCESCHGPGGRHVAEGAPRTGTILRLTEKCESCVILQICGSCHDAANDPGFEFELEDKLDRIRHGALAAAPSASAR